MDMQIRYDREKGYTAEKLKDGRIVCGFIYSSEEIIEEMGRFLKTDIQNYRIARVMAHDIIAELSYWKKYALELEREFS